MNDNEKDFVEKMPLHIVSQYVIDIDKNGMTEADAQRYLTERIFKYGQNVARILSENKK